MKASPPQTGTPPQVLPLKILPLFDQNGQRVSAPSWCRCYQTWLKVHQADPALLSSFQYADFEPF